MGAPEEGAPEALVLLSHGLGGVPAGMRVFGDALRAALGPRAVVLEARANASALGVCGAQVVTADGVEAGGTRLAEEVVHLLDAHPSVTRLSLVGLSLGGLYARFAAGALLYFSENGWPAARGADARSPSECCAGERPTVAGAPAARAAALRFRDGRLVRLQALVTLATPHLGVRGHLIPLYEFGVAVLGVGGRSTQQTILADAGGALVDLADPDSLFGRSLAMFAERWVVSNMDVDDKVPHWSSGLAPPTPGFFEAVAADKAAPDSAGGAAEGGGEQQGKTSALRPCRALVTDETNAWMRRARGARHPQRTLDALRDIGLLSDEAHAALEAGEAGEGREGRVVSSDAKEAEAGEEDVEVREEMMEDDRPVERNRAAVACAECCCCATVCARPADRRATRVISVDPASDPLERELLRLRYPLRLVQRAADRQLYPHIFSVFSSTPADGAAWVRAMEGAWWPGAHASRIAGVSDSVLRKVALLRARLLGGDPDSHDSTDLVAPEAVLCAALRSTAPWRTVHVSFAHGSPWREFLCNHHRIAGGPPFPRSLLTCLDEWPRRGGDVVRFLLHSVQF